MKKAIKYIGITLGVLLFIFLIAPFFDKEFYGIEEEFTPSLITENDSLDNYLIEENIITNSNVGFSFQAPDEWRIEKDEEFNEVNLYSPNNSGRDPVLTNGCQVTVSAVNFIREFPENTGDRLGTVEKQIENDEVINENQEIIDNGKTKILKTFLRTGSEKEKAILLEIPSKYYLIHFGFIYSLEDESYCQTEINKLIQSISVN